MMMEERGREGKAIPLYQLPSSHLEVREGEMAFSGVLPLSSLR